MLIVTYHAIAEPASAVSVPASRLTFDLTALVDAGFTFVSLDRVADWIEGRADMPARAAAITFDDGYLNVVREGLPILRRFQAPATVYVIAGRIGQRNDWPGEGRFVGPMPLVDRDAIAELVSAGVTIGSHSMTHAVLTDLSDAAVKHEVIDSADALEAIAQVRIAHFAYPYGRWGTREAEVARTRYRTAVTADCYSVGRNASLHALGRLDAHDLHLAARLGVLSGRALAPYLTMRRLGHRVSRLRGERGSK